MLKRVCQVIMGLALLATAGCPAPAQPGNGDTVTDEPPAGGDTTTDEPPAGGAPGVLSFETTASLMPSDGGALRSVATDDFDNDGDIDIAFTGDDRITIMLNAGDATFPDTTEVELAGSTFVVTGHFNADQNVDIAVSRTAVRDVAILLNNGNTGDATFADPQTSQTEGGPDSMVAEDFDGDGDLDLATGDSNGIVFFDGTSLSILLNDGQGVFQSGQTIRPGFVPRQIAAGDFDRDGAIDLAVAASIDSTTELLAVLFNNGDATFAEPLFLEAGDAPRSLTTGDFNNDGLIDIAVANYGSADISLFLSNGDRTFDTRRIELCTAFGFQSPEAMTVADLDNDGSLDLAVIGRECPAPDGTVAFDGLVLLNDGAAEFTRHEHFGVGDAPWHLSLADLDGDGDLDVVVVNFFGDRITISTSRLVP